MDILRGIVAGGRTSSLKVETVYGVPLTLSVDLDRIPDGWRAVLGPLTPSTKLKLQSGMYGDQAFDDISPLLDGRPMRLGAFQSMIWLRRTPLDDPFFMEVSPHFAEDVFRWYCNALSRGKCALDVAVLRKSSSGPACSAEDLAKFLGVPVNRKMWTIYDSQYFHDPDLDKGTCLPRTFGVGVDLRSVLSNVRAYWPGLVTVGNLEHMKESLNR